MNTPRTRHEYVKIVHDAYNPITGKFEPKQYYIYAVDNGYYNGGIHKCFTFDKNEATLFYDYDVAFKAYKCIEKNISPENVLTLNFKFWKETEVIVLYPELLKTVKDKELFTIVGIHFELNRFKERINQREFETGFKPASFDTCLRLIHSLTYDKNITYILR